MIQIKAFFKLVRWFHEVAVVIPFVGLYFIINHFATKNELTHQLSGFHITLLCLSIQLLIAAGCVLNDIMDRKIDKINKPKTHVIDNTISLRSAKIIFGILSFMILLLAIYISKNVFIEWGFIALIIYVLSISYDVYFKRSPLMGNVLMALLTAFIPLTLLFYAKDCITELNNYKINLLIYLYAALPFLIIIPRELSLDISDMEGDKADGCKTLPILIGAKRSKLVVAAFILLILFLSMYVGIFQSYLRFPFLLIDLLLLVYLFLLRKVETRIEYIRIGRFLWFIMILGLVLFTVVTII